jgi:hypothetical protein
LESARVSSLISISVQLRALSLQSGSQDHLLRFGRALEKRMSADIVSRGLRDRSSARVLTSFRCRLRPVRDRAPLGAVVNRQRVKRLEDAKGRSARLSTGEPLVTEP